MSNAANTESPKTMMDWVYRVSAGVANAVLVCLGIGLLFQALANFTHWTALYQVGTIAQVLLGPAFGVAVAMTLRANTLVAFSAMISSTIGANAAFLTHMATKGDATATGYTMLHASGSVVMTTGQPVSAVAAALVAVLVGNYLTGKTPLDMFLVPFAATFVGIVAGLGFAYVTTPFLVWLSGIIAKTMLVNPILGSAIVSVAWGLFLMTPASSAALSVAVMLSPLAAGAALIGTTAQYVGFTAISFRENDLGANIAQGVITPKVQFGNWLENPALAAGPMLSAAVMAPLATIFFHFQTTAAMGGLGLCSFIAPVGLASVSMKMFWVYIVFGIVGPAVLSTVVFKFEEAMKWVSQKQLHLTIV
ncbi:PTS transporter subunit IIC [Lacticaseibacillus jixiensis]|uniref:PTS transporter subunit IIC n=1 Tax=Lacticaseibacillus jixiensis TaxID=3231926 RepID=UPI0036F22752